MMATSETTESEYHELGNAAKRMNLSANTTWQLFRVGTLQARVGETGADGVPRILVKIPQEDPVAGRVYAGDVAATMGVKPWEISRLASTGRVVDAVQTAGGTWMLHPKPVLLPPADQLEPQERPGGPSDRDTHWDIDSVRAIALQAKARRLMRENRVAEALDAANSAATLAWKTAVHQALGIFIESNYKLAEAIAHAVCNRLTGREMEEYWFAKVTRNHLWHARHLEAIPSTAGTREFLQNNTNFILDLIQVTETLGPSAKLTTDMIPDMKPDTEPDPEPDTDTGNSQDEPRARNALQTRTRRKSADDTVTEWANSLTEGQRRMFYRRVGPVRKESSVTIRKKLETTQEGISELEQNVTQKFRELAESPEGIPLREKVIHTRVLIGTAIPADKAAEITGRGTGERYASSLLELAGPYKKICGWLVRKEDRTNDPTPRIMAKATPGEIIDTSENLDQLRTWGLPEERLIEWLLRSNQAQELAGRVVRRPRTTAARIFAALSIIGRPASMAEIEELLGETLNTQDKIGRLAGHDPRVARTGTNTYALNEWGVNPTTGGEAEATTGQTTAEPTGTTPE